MAASNLGEINLLARSARGVVWAAFIVAFAGTLSLRWVAGNVASHEIEAEATGTSVALNTTQKNLVKWL